MMNKVLLMQQSEEITTADFTVAYFRKLHHIFSRPALASDVGRLCLVIGWLTLGSPHHHHPRLFLPLPPSLLFSPARHPSLPQPRFLSRTPTPSLPSLSHPLPHFSLPPFVLTPLSHLPSLFLLHSPFSLPLCLPYPSYTPFV